jgi:hypothetical protein
MEFKGDLELNIANKLTKHYPLQAEESGYSHINFTRELAPDLKSEYFTISSDNNLLPVLEGKMIHQFNHKFSVDVRYWINEKKARNIILGNTVDSGQKLDYQTYRLGFRKIASSTNERTMIATVIPPSLCSENLQTVKMLDDQGKQIVSYKEIIYLGAIFNSFTYDYILRSKVSANINFFFVYSNQVPRLKEGDRYFEEIVERSAKLICTTPEFKELAENVGIKEGITEEQERAKIRAELDGIIAHLYGLTEAEFTHILSTFPLVSEKVKNAALIEFKKINKI